MKPVVLTIDDDQIVRKLVNKAITNLNYTSIEVPSGLEGLNYLEKNLPQLILLDIMMPVLNGFEVLKKIKNHKEWRSIPVIMFSAVSEEKQVKQALQLGANGYLLKPFRLRTVQEKVRGVLENSTTVQSAGDNGSLGIKNGKMPGVVMVVTTKSIVQNRFFRLFRNKGIRLIRANGGIEALRLLSSSTPDMIIIDQNLGLLTGPEFIEKVRQNPQWEKIPTLSIVDDAGAGRNTLGISASESETMNTIQGLWRDHSQSSGADQSDEPKQISNYRILAMAEDSSFISWMKSQVEEGYKLQIVDNSTDLIGDLLSWEPDFVLLHYEDYQKDAKGILKRYSETLRGFTIPFYMFSRKEQNDASKKQVRQMGFEDLVVVEEDQGDVIGYLDEIFGVNLIEEGVEDPIVILKRKPVKNVLAGREVIHRIVNRRKDDFSKFIIDLTSVDRIAFEELQYLGRVTNYQTRIGVKLCFVTSSEKVSETLQSFQETASVKVFHQMEEAREFMK